MSELTDKLSLQDRAFHLLKTMIDDGRLAPGEKLCDQKIIQEGQGRGYTVAGHADALRASQHANLATIKIPPVARWESIYDQLEQAICTSALFSAVRIIEDRVATHFNVSRTVVREVLARMHSVGLMNKDALDRWIAAQVTPGKNHHLYEIRWLLEPQALLQAAQRVTESALRPARETVVQSLDCFPREGFDTDVVEKDLHVRLLSSCPNVEILQVLARTRILFVPTRYLFDPVLHIPLSLIEDALKEHLHIYDLLLSRQTPAAAEALRTHLQRADDRWLRPL